MAKNKKQFDVKSFLQKDKLLLGCIIVLLLFVAFLFGKTNNLFLGSSGVQKLTPTPVITNTPTPTSIPVPTAIPKQIYVVPTKDPDPIVECNTTPNCKSVQVRDSVCANAGCCHLGDKYVVYFSESQCRHDQLLQRSITTPAPTVKSSYNDCSVGAKITQDNCIQTCLNQSNYNDNACKYAYRELNPNEELYNACYNQLMTEYNSCLDKCYQELKAKVDSCMK